MTKADNDNFPLTFTRIGLAAQRVTDRLRNPHENTDEDRKRETNSGRAGKQHTGSDSEYVEKRLSELAAFERRASGK